MPPPVRCGLCPKECLLAPGRRGDCRSRINLDGKMVTLVYGKPVAAHGWDPVEKKPLYHFLPGTRCYSVAAAGCNLHCKFCQNYQISQLDPEDAPPSRVVDLPPEALVADAARKRCRTVAYTYSEPITFYEYARDSAALARKAGLKNVLVTAGYINEAPLRELCENVDGANVDLKSFSDDFYRDYCDGTLAPVLRTLEVMRELGVWVEVTNLVVTGLNDDPDTIARLCDWLLEKLGPDTPLHFSRFRPMYKLTRLAPTPVDFLARSRQSALARGLRYVYVGNAEVPGGSDTICPGCGETAIRRRGYGVLYNGVKDGRCGQCGEKIAGVWE